MPDIVLTADPRSERGSRPAGRLRREGKVPAVVYGLGSDPVTVSVRARELGHILAGESGANTLINLEVNGDSMLTLVRQIQRHPTRGDLVHVDFVRIDRDIAVSADVPLHLIGEPTGVRDGGLLEQLVFTVTVEAMPGNIPVVFELEVSELNIGDQRRGPTSRSRPTSPPSSTPTLSSRWSRRRASSSRRRSRAKRSRARRARRPRAARRRPRAATPGPRATAASPRTCCRRRSRGVGGCPGRRRGVDH